MQDFDEPDQPSKTQRKREAEALQKLGERLVALNAEQLAGMPLDDTLREAVLEARRIRQHGGRRRQLQYIGKLMRGVDCEPIRAALERLDARSHAAAARLHRLESLREQLLASGDAALGEVLERYPAADRQHLRQLVRGARREQAQGRPPRLYRQLFRYLRELDDQQAE